MLGIIQQRACLSFYQVPAPPRAAFSCHYLFNPVSKPYEVDTAVISAFQRKRLSNTSKVSSRQEPEAGFEPRYRRS